MNNEIEKLIASGQVKIDAERQLKLDQEVALRLFRAKQQVEVERLALEQIPEALRPFAHVEEDKWIKIDHPELAQLSCMLTVRYKNYRPEPSMGNEFIEDIEMVQIMAPADRKGGWRINTWMACQDDDGHWVAAILTHYDGFGRTEDLERALAIAAELGNNREEIEQLVELRNDMRQTKFPATETQGAKKGLFTWLRQLKH